MGIFLWKSPQKEKNGKGAKQPSEAVWIEWQTGSCQTKYIFCS